MRKRRGVRLPRVFKPEGRENWVVRMRWEGRQVQRVAGTTESQANRKAAEAYTMRVQGASVDEILAKVFGDLGGDQLTFKELGALYLDHELKAKSMRPSTRADMVCRLKRLEQAAWARKPARAITVRDAGRWATERAREVRPATLNRDLSVASSVFRFGVTNGYVEENPFRAVNRPSERGNARNLFLSAEQVHDLLGVCSEDLRPLVLCAVSTGMRRSELLLLSWDDVDLEAGAIRVRSENAKTARERRVPMGARLREALRLLRSREKVVGGPVFRTTDDGQAMTPKKLQLRWAAALEAWKAKDEKDGKDEAKGENAKGRKNKAKRYAEGLRFHDLRHTAASLMINAGVDLYVVGQILGHSSAQTTKRYAHLVLDRQRDAIGALDASLQTAEKATG